MTLTDGLISVWHFNNTWKDSWGTNDGTPSGAIFDNSTFIIPTACGSFDGTDDKVSLGSSLGGQITGDFTVAGWVKGPADATNRVIFATRQLAGTQKGLEVIGYGTGNGSKLLLQADVGASAGYRESNDVIRDDTWHHFVAWRDGSVFHIDIDGSSSDGPGGNASGDITSTGVSYIGWSEVEPATWVWKGLIDELAVWDRILTSDERTQLYNNGNGFKLAEIVTDGLPSKKQISYPLAKRISIPGSNENNKWIIGE